MFKLSTEVVTNTDFSGFMFCVEAGLAFELDDYCAAYNLDHTEVDAASWKAAIEAADALQPGQWLLVSHTF